LCWLMFFSIPIGILVSVYDDPIVAGISLVELGIVFWIYRVLTSHSIRCGFFRLPEPLSRDGGPVQPATDS
jgi:hypothetical protein